MGPVEIRRVATTADVAAARALVTAVTASSGQRPLSDQLWLELAGPDPPTGFLARSPGRDGPRGYVQVSPGNQSWTVELVLDPSDGDGAVATTGATLLAAALDAVADEGGGAVHWWVFAPTAVHDEVAAAAQLAPGRRLLQMRRALPTGAPVDVATRPFRPGVDDEAWLAVNNRAFADHPEQGGWTAATLRQRQREEWFDPAGFLLHEREGRLAAFCWTKLHRDQDPAVGEIYVIGVDPDFQGLGLGHQLTLAGLESIAARGVDAAMLYVDAANTAAVGMYERLGFGVHRVDVAYTGQGAPR